MPAVFKTADLARRIRDAAFRSLRLKPEQRQRIPTQFVRIPDDGIPAASLHGAKPSVTECELFQLKENQDGDPELMRATDDEGNELSINVVHFGGAIAARDTYEFWYCQCTLSFFGWTLSAAYCDGSGSAAESGAIGEAVVGSTLIVA